MLKTCEGTKIKVPNAILVLGRAIDNGPKQHKLERSGRTWGSRWCPTTLPVLVHRHVQC